jgi:NAD(P)-dependent dehydrogenase (short-subunit alcohol dehydrogenase family)
MDVRLTGQTPVVTGGSKGIGLAVTRALADSGAHVIAGAKKSSAELDDLARTGHVQAVEVDLAAADGPARLVAAGGRVDILVNNVGATPVRTGGFLSITDDDWLATINLDLMAAVRACRAVLPAMLDAGSGAIVTICSVNARLPEPGVDYSVAKAGLASFCKALSRRLARGASGSTPSAPARSQPTYGSAPAESRRRSAPPLATSPKRWPAASQMVTGRFTQPAKSPTSCSSWPAARPATLPAPTSPSTAAMSPPGKPPPCSTASGHRMTSGARSSRHECDGTHWLRVADEPSSIPAPRRSADDRDRKQATPEILKVGVHDRSTPANVRTDRHLSNARLPGTRSGRRLPDAALRDRNPIPARYIPGWWAAGAGPADPRRCPAG